MGVIFFLYASQSRDASWTGTAIKTVTRPEIEFYQTAHYGTQMLFKTRAEY